jgi:hypothetical protein
MDRTRPLTAALAAAFACILHTITAGAQPPCSRGRPATGVPIRVPAFGPADFGLAQEACPRTGVWLETRAAVLVAKDDFYGSLLGGGSLRASIELWNRMWVTAFLPGLEYRYVANATVTEGTTTLGAGALGLHAPIARDEAYELAVYGRGLLPTETIFTRATRYGFEQGLSALVPLGSRLELASTMSFTSLVTVLPGRASPVWIPAVSSDMVYRPGRKIGLAIGAGLRPLESLDPRAEVRLYPTDPLQITLGAMVPIVGLDRTDAALGLAVGAEGF